MKKLLTLALAFVMIFVMSVTAFAVDTTVQSVTSNNTSEKTVQGTLTKTDGSVTGAVYVEITWTAGDNAITATGAGYTWDPSTCSYTTTGTPSASGSVVYTLNITNKSDCGIDYAVTYVNSSGIFNTSLKSGETHSGSVANPADGLDVNTYSTDAVTGASKTSGDVTVTVEVTGIANADILESTSNGTLSLGTLTCTITKTEPVD